jgi:hypothetical protein
VTPGPGNAEFELRGISVDPGDERRIAARVLLDTPKERRDDVWRRKTQTILALPRRSDSTQIEDHA